MDRQYLKNFGSIPVTHQNLVSGMKSYKRPNDKIRQWVKTGQLIPLTRGKYVVSEKVCGTTPSPILVANMLYGPSYVSLTYALAYYRAIPEQVAEVTSVANGRSKEIKTALGAFSYTTLSMPYYAKGIQMEHLEARQYGLIARPEKALCDILVCSRNLQLRSVVDAEYWLADMRLDKTWLHSLKRRRITEWLPSAPKQKSLLNLIKVLPGDD